MAALAGFLLAVTLMPSGCGDDERRGFAGPAPGSTTTSTGGATTTSGAGGATSSATAGGGGQGGASVSPCSRDVAFWATGMSFAAPTPYDLAAALGKALYGYGGHGVSLVVRGPELTVSATVPQSDGTHTLLGAPSFTGALIDVGAIRSAEPQASGWLRVDDDVGTVDLELRKVVIEAATGTDCSQIVAVLDAVIPVEEGEKTLTLDGDTASIADLAGGSAPAMLGWNIRALFVGETIDFDFSSLEP